VAGELSRNQMFPETMLGSAFPSSKRGRVSAKEVAEMCSQTSKRRKYLLEIKVEGRGCAFGGD